jgi:hypothetical protein
MVHEAEAEALPSLEMAQKQHTRNTTSVAGVAELLRALIRVVRKACVPGVKCGFSIASS